MSLLWSEGLATVKFGSRPSCRFTTEEENLCMRYIQAQCMYETETSIHAMDIKKLSHVLF